MYSWNRRWYRATVVSAEQSHEEGLPVFQISWCSFDGSEDTLSDVSSYYGDTQKDLSHLKPHYSLVARALRFSADRVCVPRDVGAGAARILRGCLSYCAELLDPDGAAAGRVAIPVMDRYDQDPDQFYGVR
eukprot:gnl/TRDRNA2_/TRDRNA2_166225_c0_seq2.p1 gnl/TRDRNA2_/TRDRNA2_166225_c0~~gnl/TRDRNA2_/TRDRNA2_166225_c0_seq2.p1  ORF type:complete len:131 (+),score=3.66 gnl/TRDRNA2_/TRDRNA2_166225_c0_seq2:378-770(+)